MPVQKFRSLDEARLALEREPLGPGHLARVAWVWRFAHQISPRRYPPGVHRYRTIEEASQAWEEWNR